METEEVHCWWFSSEVEMFSPLVLSDNINQQFAQQNAENHPDIIFFFATMEEIHGTGDDRWDDVWGYIRTEYDIDTNLDHVVFHLERGGYFTGYYMGTEVLTEACRDDYNFILNRMIYDLEKVDLDDNS